MFPIQIGPLSTISTSQPIFIEQNRLVINWQKGPKWLLSSPHSQLNNFINKPLSTSESIQNWKFPYEKDPRLPPLIVHQCLIAFNHLVAVDGQSLCQWASCYRLLPSIHRPMGAINSIGPLSCTSWNPFKTFVGHCGIGETNSRVRWNPFASHRLAAGNPIDLCGKFWNSKPPTRHQILINHKNKRFGFSRTW